ncbi:MAG TPA: YhcH/YjgK/YiaL family protein [Verrucomicrobiota bacterium]|nr:hypothetical protein [Verrucomicrobiales bacterium]HRI11746.1 YhcH/YjgK/YiaL family protein [Verrucomicrobiota bacterium]
MIIGSIEQTRLVSFLSQVPVLKRSFEWIKSMPTDLPEGIVELEGRELYVNVHGYETKPPQACRWESHRHTADLQFGIAGGELIDWTPLQPTVTSESYDAVKDFEIWPSSIVPAETTRLDSRRFVIFLPGEIHRPVVFDGANDRIRKLVVKIHARYLPLEL